MAELEIIGAPFSNYVRSIRMLCEEKGVTYKLTPSRPQSPEVRAIHPAGQIPVMRHGNVTSSVQGDRHLHRSHLSWPNVHPG